MHCQFCGAALEALTTTCSSCGAQPVLGDRYEIRARIGQGGMGEVFLAYDRRLTNEVALKRLLPQLSSSPELRDSLTKEARIMARLSDSAIVRLFDLAEYSAGMYVILEYVCGPSLRDVIRSKHSVTPMELAHLSEQICRGLTVAHQAGVIHRDLKPSNLLLALEGADRKAFLASRQLPPDLRTAKVKITDFGIAKAIADSGSTLTNAFSGSPGYMAPEQFRGETPSPETDIYALGVTLCELLTGKIPTSPPTFIDGVHPAVAQVIAKAMALSRQDRFHSAASFHEALYNAIEGRSPYRAPLQPARPSVKAKTILFILAAIGSIVVAVILMVVVTMEKGIHPRQVAVPLPRNDAIEIEWHSLPRVEELPPVIEEARGILPKTGLTGPRKPKTKWSVALRTTGLRIAAVGVDGTVYLTSFEGICAVRQGKLLWAHKAGMTGASNVRIAPDGRIWYHSLDAIYCVNRDGKGGRVLPKTIEEPKWPEETYHSCLFNHALAGPNWKMELDGSCAPAGAILGPDKRIYVATDIPEILAVNLTGSLAWKLDVACNATTLLAPVANHVVYACEDRTLHGINGGKETWKKRADGLLYSGVIADSAGSAYYGDYGRDTGIAHLHALDISGNELWTVDMQHTSVTNMALDNKGQIYAAGSSMNSRVVCLGD